VAQKLNLARRRNKGLAGANVDASEQRPDLKQPLPDDEFQDLFERGLAVAILEVVRRQVEPTTYQAFELSEIHGLSTEEIANATGITPNAIYLARKRVIARLRELGLEYRISGQLGQALKGWLELYPPPSVERTLQTRTQPLNSSSAQ